MYFYSTFNSTIESFSFENHHRSKKKKRNAGFPTIEGVTNLTRVNEPRGIRYTARSGDN